MHQSEKFTSHTRTNSVVVKNISIAAELRVREHRHCQTQTTDESNGKTESRKIIKLFVAWICVRAALLIEKKNRRERTSSSIRRSGNWQQRIFCVRACFKNSYFWIKKNIASERKHENIGTHPNDSRNVYTYPKWMLLFTKLDRQMRRRNIQTVISMVVCEIRMVFRRYYVTAWKADLKCIKHDDAKNQFAKYQFLYALIIPTLVLYIIQNFHSINIRIFRFLLIR